MDDIFVASCNEMTVNITCFLIISKLSTVCSSVKKLPAKNEWWIKIKVSLILKIIQWNCQSTKLKISNCKDLKDSIYFTLIWWEVTSQKFHCIIDFFFQVKRGWVVTSFHETLFNILIFDVIEKEIPLDSWLLMMIFSKSYLKHVIFP